MQKDGKLVTVRDKGAQPAPLRRGAAINRGGREWMRPRSRGFSGKIRHKRGGHLGDGGAKDRTKGPGPPWQYQMIFGHQNSTIPSQHSMRNAVKVI